MLQRMSVELAYKGEQMKSDESIKYKFKSTTFQQL